MSLLLDALKKAADDKQRKTAVDGKDSAMVEPKVHSVRSSVRDEIRSITEELSQQSKSARDSEDELLALQDKNDLAELTLEIDDHTSDACLSADIIKSDRLLNNKAGKEQPEEADMDITDKRHGSPGTPGRADYQISDDALSMLVDKTNRDVKKGKALVVISLLITSLIILLSGGVFYYLDAQAEIAAIKNKHKIAMQSMQSKTNNENMPRNREVIRNLVSDKELNDKVQYAKKHIANRNKPLASQTTPAPKPVSSGKRKQAKSAEISIQKSSKTDLLSEKLDNAWLAYENGKYPAAKKLYLEALAIEAANRDALLGLGAIAVVEKDNNAAAEYYSILLKQDPSDPIATAAMTSIYSDEALHESGEEYLRSMLRKYPEAPHLNFSLANIFAQQGKWKSAQEYYFNAWKFDNDNADYIFNLAVSMDQLNKHQQALSFYRDSLVKSRNRQVSFSREVVEKRIRELSGL